MRGFLCAGDLAVTRYQHKPADEEYCEIRFVVELEVHCSCLPLTVRWERTVGDCKTFRVLETLKVSLVKVIQRQDQALRYHKLKRLLNRDYPKSWWTSRRSDARKIIRRISFHYLAKVRGPSGIDGVLFED